MIESTQLFPGMQPENKESSSPDEEGRLQASSDKQFDALQDAIEAGLSFEELEEKILKVTLQNSNGNVSAAARHLKMGDAQLRYRLKKYNITKP